MLTRCTSSSLEISLQFLTFTFSTGMYKTVKIVFLTNWWLLFMALCLLFTSEVSSFYDGYQPPQARARPYYVSPETQVNPPVEPYPMPPLSVSSYAAPLIVPLLFADYQAYIPSMNASTEENEPAYNSTGGEEIGTESNNPSTDYMYEPRETYDYNTGEKTFWLLETTTYGADPYEGTTNVLPHLPYSSEAIE